MREPPSEFTGAAFFNLDSFLLPNCSSFLIAVAGFTCSVSTGTVTFFSSFLSVVDTVYTVAAGIPSPPSIPSLIELFAINKFVAINETNNITTIFLLKFAISRHISAKKMTALILLVTRYPNTFETAKNTIKYNIKIK